MNAPHDEATARRVQTALDFALEASKVAARAVINAFLSGEEPPSGDRFLLTMDWNPQTRAFDKAHVHPLDYDAILMSWNGLIRALGEPDYLVENAKLAAVARASIQRLKSHLSHFA
jgi:hypothetical protein